MTVGDEARTAGPPGELRSGQAGGTEAVGRIWRGVDLCSGPPFSGALEHGLPRVRRTFTTCDDGWWAGSAKYYTEQLCNLSLEACG